MIRNALGSRVREYPIPPVIALSALVLLFWSLGEFAGLYMIDSSIFFEPRYVIGQVTIVPTCLGILYGGRWLRRSDLPHTHHLRIAVYGGIGAGGFLAFNLALMAFFPTESVWLITNWVRWALSIGLAVGLVIGISQSRSVYNDVEAERQTLRAEHLEKQRDLVDHLNSILRHEVLNATQAIVGTASLLMEDDEPIDPTDERLARIHRQGEELSSVIQDVRSILPAMQAERELDVLELSTVVTSEVEKIRDRHPDATIETRLPESVYVQGDELFGRIFGNLLSNAVEHNDPESVRVVVEAQTGPEDVVVSVRDDGNGIPEEKLDTLFDRPYQGDHGLGLYLVTELVESYGGSLELVRTGAEGTTFEVTFPTTEQRRADSTGTA